MLPCWKARSAPCCCSTWSFNRSCIDKTYSPSYINRKKYVMLCICSYGMTLFLFCSTSSEIYQHQLGFRNFKVQKVLTFHLNTSLFWSTTISLPPPYSKSFHIFYSFICVAWVWCIIAPPHFVLRPKPEFNGFTVKGKWK